MTDSEILIAHNIFSNRGTYALLLGSGISRNAGILTAWEIIMKLIERLAILDNEIITDNHEQWFLKRYGAKPNYSQVIELLTTTSEERVNLLRPFFEPQKNEIEVEIERPTIAHKEIAN